MFPALGYPPVHKGTTGAGSSRVFAADGQTALGTVASAIDKLWAYPIVLAPGFLDLTGVSVTGAGGAGNKIRTALFTNVKDGILYPDRFISGTLSSEYDGTSATVQETTYSAAQYIDGGLYWVVYATGAGTVPTVNAIAVGAVQSFLGLNSTPAPITSINVTPVGSNYSSTFTAMLTGGNTFPASAAYQTAAVPLVYFRYSS